MTLFPLSMGLTLDDPAGEGCTGCTYIPLRLIASNASPAGARDFMQPDVR